MYNIPRVPVLCLLSIVQQVGRTADIEPAKTENQATTTNFVFAASIKVDPVLNTGNDGDDKGGARSSVGERIRDITAGTTGAVTKFVESAAATGGTASSIWQDETFLLPLHDIPMSQEYPEHSRTETAADGSDVSDAGAPEKPTTEVAQDDDGSMDRLGDVHLRIEVWQGTCCHGQVSIRGKNRTAMVTVAHPVDDSVCGTASDMIAYFHSGSWNLL